jgi:molybdopterin-containing oxidoreductase family iron-sulfur binding subunit
MSEANDLTRATGRIFWQGLDELVDRPEFRRRIQAKFPALSGFDLTRRDIFKCLGATLAIAGLDGCERLPDETALPYVDNPPGGPGAERRYATAVELDGVGQPIVGLTRDGRPIKLDGNPDHPASKGASDAFTQAALLGLYDPSRTAAPLREGAPATWGEFSAAAFDLARALDGSGGQGFHLLTGPVGSPTLLRQIAALKARWPALRWHRHAPLAGLGTERALPLDEVEVLVALDADPLGPGPLQTLHARRWSERRRGYQRGEGDALLFVAEPAPTLTGIAASRRLIAGPRRIRALVEALDGGDRAGLSMREMEWVTEASATLRAHPGKALVVLGEQADPALHPRIAALNASLGAAAPAASATDAEAEPLASLVEAMGTGSARAVFVLDSNPLYSTPPDLRFAQAFARVPLRIHAGLHADETAQAAHWHVPLAHLLESWSDVRAADGSAVIVQPLVRPFLDVRGRHEVLALLAGEEADGRDLVQRTWALGEDEWNQALVRGWIAAASPPQSPLATPNVAAARAVAGKQGLDLIIRPDPCIHDGQFADNPWLQELPKPVTKLTWDNAIHIAPALAARLDLANEDLAELAVGGNAVRGPVWIVPGMADETVLVHLGYGRRAAGQVGRYIGFSAYALRGVEAPWHRGGARLSKAGGSHSLASTQTHTTMAGHDFVRFVERAGESLPPEPEKPSFYPPQERGDPAWGMAIDLDLCIGCNACVSACVAENNIPMVGKDQVAQGREMHWLRVDRYYEGPPEDPSQVFQPVPCMHCEDAPCEMGCPVNATVHSPDGLNLQVYNRCIGTRTCSAYCPYKVRRFNWFDYTRDDPPEIRAARNPEVTVRDRGVMEKCTYCIQRIEREKIDADAEGRPMGEVRTACQQACPTQAIVFGNLADADSEVARAKLSPRDYDLLPEANTRPRTTYSARIRRGSKA